MNANIAYQNRRTFVETVLISGIQEASRMLWIICTTTMSGVGVVERAVHETGLKGLSFMFSRWTKFIVTCIIPRTLAGPSGMVTFGFHTLTKFPARAAYW